MYNLIGLSLRFESHIPENVVDQMNDFLVQHEDLLRYSSFGRVAARKQCSCSITCQWNTEEILLTYRLWHQAVRQVSFRWWGAISASQTT